MKIRTMYADRLPIIVEKAPNSQVPDICKKKYVYWSSLQFTNCSIIIICVVAILMLLLLLLSYNSEVFASVSIRIVCTIG